MLDGFTGAQRFFIGYAQVWRSRFREEARRIIRDAVGGSDEHAVIFCGSGMTAAIAKLIDVLNLRLPNDLDDRYGFRARIPATERPVVFIGPVMMRSWMCGADVIPEPVPIRMSINV